MKALALKFFGVLLLLTALTLALTQAPDWPVQALVARWALPPSDFIEVKGQLVHVRDEGPKSDPEPVLLLHGTSASLHTWEGWAAALRTQRRVITVDLPGFGLTGPNATADYRGDTYARFALDVMDALKVPRFVVGGNSLGGEVAWRTALLAPQRVSKLILVDAGGPPFKPVSVPIAFTFARLPVLNKVLDWILPRPLVLASLRSVYGNPDLVTPALVERYYELTLREGNRRALVQRFQQTVIGQDSERIAALKLPTLILWGGRDRLIPPETAQVFARAIAGSRVVMFDALGHVPHEEDPAQTIKPVLAFLQGI